MQDDSAGNECVEYVERRKRLCARREQRASRPAAGSAVRVRDPGFTGTASGSHAVVTTATDCSRICFGGKVSIGGGLPTIQAGLLTKRSADEFLPAKSCGYASL